MNYYLNKKYNNIFLRDRRCVDLPVSGINLSEMLVEVRKYSDVQIVVELMGCGERSIESYCSWFLLKFPLGKLSVM